MTRKETLQEILRDNPEGKKTKNKYRVLRAMIVKRYPQLLAVGMSKDTLESMIYDLVNGDRDWRKLTEDVEKVEKKILSQQWVLDNGYEMNYHQDQKLF